jgi:hypothetical protein
MNRFATRRFPEARLLGAAFGAAIFFAACTASPPAPGPKGGTSEVAPSTPASVVTIPTASADAKPGVAKEADDQEARRARFAQLTNDLSEPDAEFFSDNLISNETSYLQVADSLSKHARPDGVYLGVGPEQNFTYIARTRPSLAFIVDIRRQNLLLHLLYKAAFEEAKSRSHFLSLMLGRSHADANDSAATDGIDAVLADVGKDSATSDSFAGTHALLMKRIDGYGVKLSAEDEKHIDALHKAFFDGQLGLRFSLKENNGRTYPTLSEVLAEKGPDGKPGGFLATEDGFREVQTMEKEHRIIPVVGDFAGDHALPGVAAYLAKENLVVSAFYVSNVEQYLLEPKVFEKWQRNVRALPKDAESLFIRAYLDQGKKHPRELAGHRTATVLQSMRDFDDEFGKKKTSTLYELSTYKVID